MIANQTKHPLKILSIYLIVLILLDLAFVIFALTSGSTQLYLFPFFNICTLPLWVNAFVDLFLRRKIELEERQKNEAQSTQIFEESYEHILLERQKNFTRKRLQPLLILLSTAAFTYLFWQVYNGQFAIKLTEFSSATQAGLILFRISVIYILSRYIIGISVPLKQGHSGAVAGLGLYQTALGLVLIASVLTYNDALMFVYNYLSYLPLFVLGSYVIEVLIRFVISFYNQEAEGYPASFPIIAQINVVSTLKEAGKESVSYQFGYDIQSSVKELVGKKIIRLLIIFTAFILLSTCVGIVNQGHEAYILNFGKISRVKQAGLYFKAPWPLSEVVEVDVTSLKRVSIGDPEDGESFMWNTQDHDDSKERFFLTRDNQQSIGLPLERYATNAVLYYEITNARQYIYQHEKVEDFIKSELERILTLKFIDVQSSSLFHAEKYTFEEEIKGDLQQRLDKYKCGVQISYFSIPKIHPPAAVTESFEETITARFEKSIAIAEAKAESLSKRTLIKAEVHSRINEARSAATKIKSLSQGDLNYFSRAKEVMKAYPKIFIERKKLEALAEYSAEMRKILLLKESNTSIQNLNLERSLDTEFLERSLLSKEQK